MRCNDLVMPVKQNRDRQSDQCDMEAGHERAFPMWNHENWVPYAVLGQKVPHGASRIQRNADHLQVTVGRLLIFSGQLVEKGQFFAAGCTPGSPKVDQCPMGGWILWKPSVWFINARKMNALEFCSRRFLKPVRGQLPEKTQTDSQEQDCRTD